MSNVLQFLKKLSSTNVSQQSSQTLSNTEDSKEALALKQYEDLVKREVVGFW